MIVRRGMMLAGAIAVIAWPRGASAEEARSSEPPPNEAQPVAGEEDLPAAASRRYHLVEPVGPWPSPWAALSAALDGGSSLDGSEAWTAVRVHVPVYRRHGAVDVRLDARFNGDELISLDPELVLRGLPFRWAEGRGAVGFALSMRPGMTGPDPTLTLGGGLTGGHLGQRWFAWAYAGVLGDVLQGHAVEIAGLVAAGLRLPRGFEPQLEVEVVGEARRRGDVRVALRPALRYWPADWVGIGLSADVWVFGREPIASTVRLDLVFHAEE